MRQDRRSPSWQARPIESADGQDHDTAALLRWNDASACRRAYLPTGHDQAVRCRRRAKRTTRHSGCVAAASPSRMPSRVGRRGPLAAGRISEVSTQLGVLHGWG